MIPDKLSELICATGKALGIADVSPHERGRSGGAKRKCCLLGIEQAYGQMAIAWQGGSGAHECRQQTHPRQHRATHCAHFFARTYRNACAVFWFCVVSMSVVKSKVIIVSSHIRSWSFINSLSAISTYAGFSCQSHAPLPNCWMDRALTVLCERSENGSIDATEYQTYGSHVTVV